MNAFRGLPRINLHKVRSTLDASNQVTIDTKVDRVCCIKDGSKMIKSIIDPATNIATVYEDGYTEGSEVDVWCFCFCAHEAGGICAMEPDATNEAQMQIYEEL